MIFHFHRWPKWGDPVEGTKTIHPSPFEVMTSKNWAGVPQARPLKFKVYFQTRRCETCGAEEDREVPTR